MKDYKDHTWEEDMWPCKPPALVQYVSNILAAICSCGIHLYIIVRLISNYYKLSHYRIFVVAQSTVYIIDSVEKLITNKVRPPIFAPLFQ